MAALPKIVLAPLTEKARAAVTAHAAIHDEIATHVEKEKLAREARYHKLEIKRGIKPVGRT